MVESARLESEYTLTGIVGSNPTLSTILRLFAVAKHWRKEASAGCAARGRFILVKAENFLCKTLKKLLREFAMLLRR